MMDLADEAPPDEPIKMMDVADEAPMLKPIGPPSPPLGIMGGALHGSRDSLMMPGPKAPWEGAAGNGGNAEMAEPSEVAPENTVTDPDQAGFDWSECGSLIANDALGALLRVPCAAAWPAVQMKVRLHMPLLYWKERRRWMWHKKWSLPKLHVSVTLNGRPLDATVGGGPPLYVIVSA